MEGLGLYVHIPFCKSKCYYCDFNSYANKNYVEEKYMDSLIKEIDLRSSILDKYRISSIYVGGGTPTYLKLDSIYKLLSCLKGFCREGVEYTWEANPGTLSYEKLMMLKDGGVNRLSIGLQSWDDNILKGLGRIHSVHDFVENFETAREVGFRNINVDLMFSIENQSLENLGNTLDNVIGLKPEHISCYSLIIEEGTEYYRRVKEGTIAEIDEELDREMYYLAVKKLESAGYKRYEISNFARQGYECTHNIIYWKTKPYLGIGAGAHSYIGTMRFSNERLPEDYICKVNDSKLPVCWCEELSTENMMSEFMFMGLRMSEGVGFKEFRNRFNRELTSVYGEKIDELIDKGLLAVENGRLMLTEKGIDLSNQVFVEFI